MKSGGRDILRFDPMLFEEKGRAYLTTDASVNALKLGSLFASQANADLVAEAESFR